MRERAILCLPVLLAACGTAATPRSATQTAWPSVTWSVKGVGLNVDHEVPGGMYTAHLNGCVRAANIAPVDQDGTTIVGAPLTIYNGKSVVIPQDGLYAVVSMDAADCTWTLTLTPS